MDDDNDLTSLFGSIPSSSSRYRYGHLQLDTPRREGHAVTLLADHVFNSAFALAEAIETGEVSCAGGSVIEFGSASGLPSLLLATGPHPPRLVTLTDHPVVVSNAQRNATAVTAQAAEHGCQVITLPHCWGEQTAPLLAANEGKPYDLALLSDLLYLDSVAAALVASLADTLAPTGRALIYAGRYTPQSVIDRFETLLAERSLRWRELPMTEGWRGTTDIEGVVWSDDGTMPTTEAVKHGMAERKAQVRAWEAGWSSFPLASKRASP